MLVKISMKVLDNVTDSLLALTVPDEKAITITAGQLSMKLGRYSRQRLSGLEIKAGKGWFRLPSESLLIVSGVKKTSFVDAKVGIYALKVNLMYSWRDQESICPLIPTPVKSK